MDTKAAIIVNVSRSNNTGGTEPMKILGRSDIMPGIVTGHLVVTYIMFPSI